MTDFDLNKRWCYYFNEISKIPRGSRNEKAISDYVVAFAKKHNLNYSQDEYYNVIIEKNASEGYEKSSVLVLQAHMDMVCEKNKDCDHDFTKDPLNLYVEDGILHAKGTTLGADDGTGVAYMLAILDDDNLEHPPLQCFFTTMEEIGLIGALMLPKGCVKGDRMINLDGGGEIYCGLSAAGGADGLISCKLEYIQNNDPVYHLAVRGLSGGHSAGAISKEKGNANTLLVRILKEAELKGLDINLVSLEGGMKDNAIPREADALFATKSNFEDLQASFNQSMHAIKEELAFSDPNFRIELKTSHSTKKIKPEISKNILDYIFLMPNGFRHKSMAIEGLTLTSLNLGVVKIENDEIILDTLMRSAIDSGVDHLIDILKVLAEHLNMEFKTEARYPGWNYMPESKMRDLLKEVIKEKTGQDLVTMAGHGGNECGVFAGLKPGIDIINIGPIAKDIHTPDESLDLASFDRTYEILKTIIKRCH